LDDLAVILFADENGGGAKALAMQAMLLDDKCAFSKFLH